MASRLLLRVGQQADRDDATLILVCLNLNFTDALSEPDSSVPESEFGIPGIVANAFYPGSVHFNDLDPAQMSSEPSSEYLAHLVLRSEFQSQLFAGFDFFFLSHTIIPDFALSSNLQTQSYNYIIFFIAE